MGHFAGLHGAALQAEVKEIAQYEAISDFVASAKVRYL